TGGGQGRDRARSLGLVPERLLVLRLLASRFRLDRPGRRNRADSFARDRLHFFVEIKPAFLAPQESPVPLPAACRTYTASAETSPGPAPAPPQQSCPKDNRSTRSGKAADWPAAVFAQDPPCRLQSSTRPAPPLRTRRALPEMRSRRPPGCSK